MGNGFIRKALLTSIGCSVLLSGCGGFNVWPFGGEDQDKSLVPANATEYKCDQGKRFYVRYMDNGNAAWLILPDREVSLPKVASAAGTRYSNGISVLNINGNEATLEDGATKPFTGCKAAGK